MIGLWEEIGLGIGGYLLLGGSGGDSQIESLDLAGTKTTGVKGAAYLLRKQFGSTISFISGHRDDAAQANAMASHVVSSRTWISDTYKTSTISTAMQTWVTNNPSATTQAAIAAGLLQVLQGYPASTQTSLSLHLADPSQAVDVQPITGNTEIPAAMQSIATTLGSTVAKFLQNEGGATVWHLQIKGTPAIPSTAAGANS